MIYNQKQRIKKYAIGILIFGILCFGYNQTYAANGYLDRLDSLTDPINSAVSKEKTDKGIFNEIVETFCKTMTDGDSMIYGNSLYSAKNSLFMYRLCTDSLPDSKLSIKRGAGLSEEASTSYMLFEDMPDGSKVNKLKEMLPDAYQRTAKYTDSLFTTIISNYISIYQAAIYGQIGLDSMSIDNLADVFSKTYFGYQKTKYISICAKDMDYSYPKTCTKLKNYLSKSKNSLNSSDIGLSIENMYKAKDSSKCDPSNTKGDYNHIICGLYKNDMTKFVNLVYNELFFYTSFAQYYAYIIGIQPEFKAKTNDTLDEKRERKYKEIALVQQNIADTRQAISVSIKMLKELQMTFPIHIGMLMYTEAINTFVFNFNKILTPIYTLGDIFRNVQDTK